MMLDANELYLKYDDNRRSLNSNHHLVDFFPRFVGGRMVMPSVQRANGALILAAIKSTRLVANANRPEGIFAFSVSPYYHSTENHISPPRWYTNPVSPELCHAHHVEPTCRMAVLQPPGHSAVILLVLGNQLRFKKKEKKSITIISRIFKKKQKTITSIRSCDI